jgi:hypothetical protein
MSAAPRQSDFPTTDRKAVGLDLIVSHPGAHVDEHVAAALLKLGGSPNAKVLFLNDAEIAALPRDKKVAFVGTGHGLFDEHKQDGRVLGECAATLVAKHFGFDRRPEFAVLLAEILRADTERGQGSLEWGEVVKTLHRYGDPEVVNDIWVGRFIAAVVNAHLDEQGGKPSLWVPQTLVVNGEQPMGSEGRLKPLVGTIAVPAYAGFETLAKLWLVRQFGKRRWSSDGQIPDIKLVNKQTEIDQMAARHDVIYVGFEGGQFPASMTARQVANFFGISKKNNESGFQRVRVLLKELERYAAGVQKPFEMGNLVSLLNRSGTLSAEAIERIVGRVLDAYLARAIEFAEQCPRDFEATGKIEKIHGLTVAFVVSELPSMQSYCRSQLSADVIVVRKDSGAVAIFTNSDHRGVVVPIAEALYRAEATHNNWKSRQLEMGVMALRTIGYTDQGNELPEPASHWYLFVEGGQLLNGSLSHTDVPPTLLTRADIKAAVREGLMHYSKN